jgi:putative exosortase-associated protein (TIGR04073 family)
MQTSGAATKLGRGAVNLVTGWVEIPKRIYETTQTQGALAGWTWGLLRGLGRGFVRTAAGLYEVFTFPFPAPPDYAPVIEPEYVFIDEGIKPAEAEHQYR